MKFMFIDAARALINKLTTKSIDVNYKSNDGINFYNNSSTLKLRVGYNDAPSSGNNCFIGCRSSEVMLSNNNGTTHAGTYYNKHRVIAVTSISNLYPEEYAIYTKTIKSGDKYTFSTSPSNYTTHTSSFRLYLTMPNPVVSFSITGVKWIGDTPTFTSPGLYRLVFEWCPVKREWLGNKMMEVE